MIGAKQVQAKHWEKCSRPCTYKTTLEKFWNRAGIRCGEDETIIRTFRLEIMYGKENRKSKFARFLRNNASDHNYALAA